MNHQTECKVEDFLLHSSFLFLKTAMYTDKVPYPRYINLQIFLKFCHIFYYITLSWLFLFIALLNYMLMPMCNTLIPFHTQANLWYILFAKMFGGHSMCALIPLFGLMMTSVLGFKVITKKQWIPQIYIWYDICQLTFQAGVKTKVFWISFWTTIMGHWSWLSISWITVN